MMARLIDADALYDRLKDLNDWCRDCRKPGIEQAMSMITESPTISNDTIQGKWKRVRFTKGIIACSECGYYFQDKQTPHRRYCLNCGAKMGWEVV
jgi:hypothetical protein